MNWEIRLSCRRGLARTNTCRRTSQLLLGVKRPELPPSRLAARAGSRRWPRKSVLRAADSPGHARGFGVSGGSRGGPATAVGSVRRAHPRAPTGQSSLRLRTASTTVPGSRASRPGPFPARKTPDSGCGIQYPAAPRAPRTLGAAQEEAVEAPLEMDACSRAGALASWRMRAGAGAGLRSPVTWRAEAEPRPVAGGGGGSAR